MTKKIKLLVITHSYPTKINPIAGIFVKNQYDFIKNKFDIKIVFPYPYVPKFKKFNPYYKYSTVPFKENIGGIEVYHPRYIFFPRVGILRNFINIFLFFESFFSYLSSKELISKLQKEWDFDVIMVHGCISESISAVAYKKKYNKKLLVTIHGEDVTRFSKVSFLRILSKFILKNSNAIVCKSNSLKKEVLGMGIVNKDIYVIPSGYAVSRFKPKPTQKCRKKLNLPPNKKIILFVGHLIKRKGPDYLIKAIKLVIKKNKNIACYIIGGGVLETELKNLAIKLNLKDFVFFVGMRKPKEVPLWMNACDILVLPSLNDGFPNVLTEAIACRKPVIGTKVGGIPDIINNDVGYIVEPKDMNNLAKRILQALDKKWDKGKLIERSKKFSVNNFGKKLADTITKYGASDKKS
jgi:glycosyltransferase involved in cell wall biosynthesis